MKNYRNLFIKYLDDQLSRDEKIILEESLITDKSLNEEFHVFRETFLKSKKNPELDEKYFTTLLPKVREHQNSISGKRWYKYAFVISVLIFGFLFLSRLYESDDNYDFESLLESFISDEQIFDELVSDSFEYVDFYYDDIELAGYPDQNLEIDKSLFEYLSSEIRPNDINENIYYKMTPEEFNEIYNQLKETKYLGEK